MTDCRNCRFLSEQGRCQNAASTHYSRHVSMMRFAVVVGTNEPAGKCDVWAGDIEKLRKQKDIEADVAAAERQWGSK